MPKYKHQNTNKSQISISNDPNSSKVHRSPFRVEGLERYRFKGSPFRIEGLKSFLEPRSFEP
jgi:hypothetical protein